MALTKVQTDKPRQFLSAGAKLRLYRLVHIEGFLLFLVFAVPIGVLSLCRFLPIWDDVPPEVLLTVFCFCLIVLLWVAVQLHYVLWKRAFLLVARMEDVAALGVLLDLIAHVKGRFKISAPVEGREGEGSHWTWVSRSLIRNVPRLLDRMVRGERPSLTASQRATLRQVVCESDFDCFFEGYPGLREKVYAILPTDDAGV